jgi:hypothetical protein
MIWMMVLCLIGGTISGIYSIRQLPVAIETIEQAVGR